MFPVPPTFPLKYTNCQYLTYDIINSTSIQFVSECLFPELNTTQVPMLNLTLIMDNQSLPTLKVSQFLGSLKVNLSNLTNLKTLVF